MCRFSIIVATYNSPISKILLTLESVLRQTFTDYEIIITDDGSLKNNFDKIEIYLKKRGFKSYGFIKHRYNQGTVKNIQNAYENSKGKYVKALGPGDLLYSENTLFKLSEFLEERNSNFTFGRLKAYEIQNDLVMINSFVAPPNSKIYDYENKEKALQNIVEYNLYISGSTMVFKRSYILQEKYNLKNAKYCEDLVQILIAINGEKIDFFDCNMVWYEYGSGISTNEKGHSKLHKDHLNFFTDLQVQFPKNKLVKKHLAEVKIKEIKNPMTRKVLIVMNKPKRILLKITNLIKKRTIEYKSAEEGFLEEGLSINLIEEVSMNS